MGRYRGRREFWAFYYLYVHYVSHPLVVAGGLLVAALAVLGGGLPVLVYYSPLVNLLLVYFIVVPGGLAAVRFTMVQLGFRESEEMWEYANERIQRDSGQEHPDEPSETQDNGEEDGDDIELHRLFLPFETGSGWVHDLVIISGPVVLWIAYGDIAETLSYAEVVTQSTEQGRVARRNTLGLATAVMAVYYAVAHVYARGSPGWNVTMVALAPLLVATFNPFDLLSLGATLEPDAPLVMMETRGRRDLRTLIDILAIFGPGVFVYILVFKIRSLVTSEEYRQRWQDRNLPYDPEKLED